MKHTIFFFWTLVVIFAIIGCSPHSINIDPQPVVTGDSYLAPTVEAIETPAEGSWWKTFNDPILSQIIETALSSNLTVEQGVARLLQAKALLEQSRGIRFPQLDLAGTARQSWDRDRESDTQSTIGVGFSWDPDLFSRLHSSQLARFYDYQSQEYALEDLKLELSILVAQTYFSALEQHIQLLLLQKQVEIDTDLLDLVKRNFDAGVVSRVDYLQQMGQLADTESLVPVSELSLKLFENRLAILMGQTPKGASEIIQYHESFPEVPVQPASGVPSELLLNRPDLASKRSSLLAADAEIGRAIAERLPSINLNGSYLYSAGSDGSGFVSDVVGSLLQPLLNWGIRKAEVERNKALYQERLYDFTQSYLLAIEEVEGALHQINRLTEYVARLKRRDEILRETLEETQRRYSAGVTDYLPVLDTLQELRRIERTLVTEKKNLILAHALLFRALGSSI